MEKYLTHKHHIIPKHAGGTNHPDNIVVLTVEEHAEAHRLLWEEHQNKWDYIAWKTLCRDWTHERIRREVTREVCRRRNMSDKHPRTGTATPQWARDNWSKKQKEAIASGRWKLTEEGREILRESGKQVGKLIPNAETRAKLSLAAKNRKKIVCEVCGKSCIPQMYSRWHGNKCKHSNKDLKHETQ
jgi:hypothetical protein